MDPIIVLPPLRGEWNAINTPGDKVPSHGTDNWAMTFAYDFIRFKKNENGMLSWQSQSLMKYLLGNVKLIDSYSWGQSIYSPINGTVREVVNNIKERNRLHVFSDIGLAFLNGIFFSYKNGKVQKLSGNYLIIEGNKCCAFIAHTKFGSIQHKVGAVVTAGEVVAQVGHSGNSTAPHLHFQLMDRVDIKSAKGLPCAFESYDIYKESSWDKIQQGIPSSRYTIRFA